MKNREHSRDRAGTAIEVFQPKPDVLYNLDAAAHLAGVTRRSILIYGLGGVVAPFLGIKLIDLGLTAIGLA